MYKEIVKCPKRQDCHYKLTPGSSNETSINISNEVLRVICPTVKPGSTTPITFRLYKEDFIKALCYIVTRLPLFTTNSRNNCRVDYTNEFFNSELSRINSFFQNDVEDYLVSLYYREDGRIYLKDLTYHHFNIRKFLVEGNTSMHFIVGSNINLRMQYSDSPTEDDYIVTERLAVRDNILKDFIYKAVYLLNKFDGLKAIEPYVNEISENIQIICDNHFKLTGMFIATTLRDLAARNKYGEKQRWFETPYTLCDKTVYLSTQWYGAGDYSLMYGDFSKLVEKCYGERFKCKKNNDGEFELLEISTNLTSSTIENKIINLSNPREAFKAYLDYQTNLSIRSKQNYLSILERDSIVGICNTILNMQFISIYDIIDSEKLINIIESKLFVEFDNKAHHQYSCAIKYYIDFLCYNRKV